MKIYKPIQAPQEYSNQLSAININLKNIDNEIRNFIGEGDINQIDFKQNTVPSFVQKKLFGYVSSPDFSTSMLLGSVHSLLSDFTGYRKEFSLVINNEMKKDIPDLFVMKMLEGMRKYRQLYKEKEKQCSLLPELIAYYQTGNNPYIFLYNGRVAAKWGEMQAFELLDLSCRAFLEIADYYKSTNKQTTAPIKQTEQLLTRKHDFKNIIQYEDKERLLNRLHELIDGKGGADVGAVLLNARMNNLLTRNPTRKEFENEFRLISSWSAISNYMSDNNANALDRANKIIIFS